MMKVFAEAVAQRCSVRKDSNTGLFLWILQSFKNIFFTEHLLAIVSAFWSQTFYGKYLLNN